PSCQTLLMSVDPVSEDSLKSPLGLPFRGLSERVLRFPLLKPLYHLHNNKIIIITKCTFDNVICLFKGFSIVHHAFNKVSVFPFLKFTWCKRISHCPLAEREN
ncbi:unnamed protein product, partial [Owenia fusiformis]